MQTSELKKYIIETLKAKGAEKVSVMFFNTEKTELNSAAGELTLLRTTINNSIVISALKDNKNGRISLNKRTKKEIDKAIEDVILLMESSKPDEANEIAEYHPKTVKDHLPLEADLDQMYMRIEQFLAEAKKRYPTTILEEVILDFTRSNTFQANSNGVENITSRGYYTVTVMFTSKIGKQTSSFNYVSNVRTDLDIPIIEFDSIDRLLQQSAEQTTSTALAGKFTGDVIVTPECLGNFVGKLSNYISEYPLITKTSLYLDKKDTKIASDCFSLKSSPLGDEMAIGYDFTGDMHVAENLNLIEKGILKNYIVGLYGSRKTGFPRVSNSGGCLVVDPGNSELDEMIKSTKKGILLCRFSGGNPANNGDFSGVAKNSYYIENGKIMYPITESMVSGNIAEMFLNAKEISKDRINTGYSLYPWMKFAGLTISGK